MNPMKALMLGKEGLAFGEVARPRFKEGFPVVKIRSLSLCTTDLEILEGRMKVRKVPIIIGHEAAGVVVDNAGKASGLERGVEVLIDPNHSDGTCFACKLGLTNLCVNGGLMGRDTDGVFCEYLAVPADRLYVLPKGVSLHKAPLLQPLSTVVHAFNRAGLRRGETVAVLGTGVTGLMAVMVVRALGGRPLALSSGPSRLGLARELGAECTAELGEGLGTVDEFTQKRGVDVVFESTGHADRIRLAPRLLRRGGTLVEFGISSAALAINSQESYHRELTVMYTRSSVAHDFKQTLRMSRSERMLEGLSKLITAELPFEGAIEAVHKFKDRRRSLKILIDAK